MKPPPGAKSYIRLLTSRRTSLWGPPRHDRVGVRSPSPEGEVLVEVLLQPRAVHVPCLDMNRVEGVHANLDEVRYLLPDGPQEWK